MTTLNCVVTNQFPGNIQQVMVSHQWTETSTIDGSTTTPQASVLSPGGTFSFPITVGSGGRDLWSVSFMYNGLQYYRNNKQCDVTQSDISSEGTVYINLISPTNGFSIELPKSSSCTDNYLNSGN
jgi:hypothetical protein